MLNYALPLLLLVVFNLTVSDAIQQWTFPAQDDSYSYTTVYGGSDINSDSFSDIILGAPSNKTVRILFGNNFPLLNTFVISNNANLFGSDIAVGDLNSDTYPDLIVGASAGVYVYYGPITPSTQTPDVTVLPPPSIIGSDFGLQVSIGDFDGNGVKDLAVACHTYQNGQLNEGAVFFYSGGQLGGPPVYIYESNLTGSFFGFSMDVGDFNNDNKDDVLVGAYGKNSNQGAAYLIQGASSFSFAGLVTLPVASPFPLTCDWGYSVAAGDVTGDNIHDMCIGSPRFPPPPGQGFPSNQGAVFCISGSATSTYTPIGALLVGDNLSSNYFGYSVAITGDVNGDGVGDVWAAGESVEPKSFSMTPITNVFKAPVPRTIYVVSNGGDVDNDGLNDLLLLTVNGTRTLTVFYDNIVTSPTPSTLPTPSVTPSTTRTPSVTPSVTPSSSPSVTPTPSLTPSVSPSRSPSPSATPTPTSSITPSVTPSISISPSVTPSPSPTTTPTPSATASITPSRTPSTTTTPSITPTTSISPSVTASPDSKSKDKTAVIAGATAGGVGGVGAALAIAACLVVRRRKRKDTALPEEENSEKPMDDKYMEMMTPGTVSPALSPSSSISPDDKKFEIPYRDIKLGHEIGHGAFGVVYKGEWRNSDCVVKQMNINRSDTRAIHDFLKEAKVVRDLRNHHNVCSIFGVCTDPEFPICIVMEYVSGGSLFKLVVEDELPLDDLTIIRFGKDVCAGMSHIHQENLLHCDLAARNLLVEKRNDRYLIKVTDFGLARLSDSGIYNASEAAIFPVRWSAPEVISKRIISRASDIWSFGVVLWEIVEAKQPYFGLMNPEVVDLVCVQKKTLNKPTRRQFPEEIWNMMKRCWEFDPDARPTFDQLYKEFSALEKIKENMAENSSPEISEEERSEARKKSMIIYGNNSTNSTS